MACVASSSHACADEYLLATGRFGEGEAFSLSRGWVSSSSFARFLVTARLTGDLRGVPPEWSPMRGSGDSGRVRRASGDLMDAAARRRIGGDVAAAAVFAEAFASPLGSRGKMAGQHAAWGAGGSGIRDEAFGVRACAYLLAEASSRCFLPLRTPTMYPTTTPSTHVATATRGTEPRCSGDPSNGLSPRVGRARARGRLGSTDAVAFATNAGPLGPADTTSAAVIAPECTRLARAGSAEKRQTAPADSESCCESAPRHSRRFASTPRKRNRKRSVVAKTGRNTSRDGCRAPGAADGGRARR